MQPPDPVLGEIVSYVSQGLAVTFTVLILVAAWRGLPKFWAFVDEVKQSVKDANAESARQNLASHGAMAASNSYMAELTRLFRQHEGRLEKIEDDYKEMRRDHMVAFDRVERAIRDVSYPREERRSARPRHYTGEEKRSSPEESN